MMTVFRTFTSIIQYDHAAGHMIVLSRYRVPMAFMAFWIIVKRRRSQCRQLGIDYQINQDQQ